MLLKELIELCKDCDIYVLEKVKTDYIEYDKKVSIVINNNKGNYLKYYNKDFLNSQINSIQSLDDDSIGVFLKEEC